MNSSPLPPAPALDPSTRVGEIVAARPLAARVFERLYIDYCCGGRLSLAEACARRGLAVETVLGLLESDVANATAAAEFDAAALGLTALANHIESTHHAYVKAELPRLLEMAERVATKHGGRDPRLPSVAAAVRELAGEMLLHLHKEEVVLFPLIRELDQGLAPAAHCGSIEHPIRQMENEHDGAGELLARLRTLTDGFEPAADDCNTHRALLAGLAAFEQDLHRHIHKENNILFPRALRRAAHLG